ncbi:demethoxyubiquinone hydroxylase family protein [Maricaulis sp. CAU 1757]
MTAAPADVDTRRHKPRPPLPGTRRDGPRLAEMIRVDHAGEYGAVTIYRGQRAIFSTLPHKARIARQLRDMEAEEQHHLDAFDGLILNGDTRPTLLAPLWKAAGTALGMGTALLGDKAAHACTEAVETVIEQHYAAQIEELRRIGEDELADLFTLFREEEIAHRDTAIEEGSTETPGHRLLTGLIEAGCRVAIGVSERV